MKKLLLITMLFAGVTGKTQCLWDSVILDGVSTKTRFSVIHNFQNKLYTGGTDSNGVLKLFSSSTGSKGSFVEETGLAGVTQGAHENKITSIASNNSLMVFGTGVDSVKYQPLFVPAVYKYDGISYTKHGTIPLDTMGADSITPNYQASIAAVALFSPTGSNDSIYAFVNPGGTGISIWKSPVASPNWVNSAKFTQASGITYLADAIVWHKRLYVSTSGPYDGLGFLSYIFSTGDGITWDTVAKNSTLLASVGQSYYSNAFGVFEIHKDTLMVTMHGNYAVWYTSDSLTATPTWRSLIDGAVFGSITGNWTDLTDMQSAFGQLWLQVKEYNGGSRQSDQNSSLGTITDVWMWKNSTSQLYQVSGGSGIESGSNDNSSFRLNYLNNYLYSSGTALSPDVTFDMHDGNTWRTTTPVASFIDSVSTGSGYCAGGSIFLVSTSQNANSYGWYVNGSLFSTSQNASYFPTKGEVDVIKLIAYNGPLFDTISKTITIFSAPLIDSATAATYTVCQAQPNVYHTYVSAGSGAAPYTYTWNNAYDQISYAGDSTTVIQLYTVPTFSPYIYMSVSVKDANMCTGYGPVVYMYVNAADSLSGLISDTLLNPVTAGKVYLFQKKLNHVGVADSAGMAVICPAGTYNFPGLYYGDYYLKAVADTSDPLYHTSVGTYYSNKPLAYQWDSAVVIQQHTCTGGNNNGKNITIIQMPVVVSGPGTITGIVTEGPGYGLRYGSGSSSPMGAPLKGVDVKLGKNPGGNAAARTTTDGSGNYSFHNVPLGSYKIYVDIPNYGMDSVRAITLSTTDTLSVHNDYFVDSSMVRVVPTFTAITTICQGDSILLQNAYQHNAGVYYDTLTATAGYDSLIMTNLSITALATVTVTANTFTVCSGSSVILTAGGATSYAWSSNAGSVTTATTSVNPVTLTTYTVTGTANGCPVTKTISVNTYALPNVTASSSVDSVCAGGSVTLVGGGATTYTWSNGVTNWVPFNPATTNTYTVSGTGANACVNTATVTVVVKSCIGIRQISAAGLLNVYPNPAMNSLFIEVEKSAKIKIYDITGQLVMEQSINIGKNEISISSLPSGAYDLMLNANGQITYVKLMVNK